ncbi:MAG: hypothetical protein KDA22_06270 [Phycisphaerales bacterium]|nr:hypothetical protein [Phycisphaerales bacterium]
MATAVAADGGIGCFRPPIQPIHPVAEGRDGNTASPPRQFSRLFERPSTIESSW